MNFVSVALVLLSAVASIASAQDSRGAIIGRVTDASGAAVPGAKVHAVYVDTNTGGYTVTNQEGNFEIPFLLPGTYRVTVEHASFKKAVGEGIRLQVDDRLALDFTLQLGEVTQSVVVSGETPLLDISSAGVGKVIDDKQITELPIAGGNPFYLTRLTAGVMASGGHQPGNPTQDFGSGSIIVNGTRSGSSEVSIDGASNMSGSGSSFSPPGDLVQEFKIQTLPFDASLGHGVGAVVNVSIKSGTNTLHGTAYYIDSRLRAAPWFYNHWLYDPNTGPITPEKKAQSSENAGWMYLRWGQTLGGPLVVPKVYNGKNRTFWVFGYEGMRVNRTQTYTGTVPTPQELGGDFSGLLGLGSTYQIYDPATIADAGNGQFSRQPIPGNIIPASRIDSIARKISKEWPAPNSPGKPGGEQNYFRIRDQGWDYRSELGRFDHAFGESHRVYGRWNQSHFRQVTQNLPTVNNGTIQNTDKWGAVLDDVYVISPAFLANVRYSITRQTPTTLRPSQGFDLTSLGFPATLVNEIKTKNDPKGLAFPLIAVDDYVQLGSDGGSSSATTYQTWAGTLTRMMGNHSLRFGGEFRLLRETGYAFGNVAPNLSFSTSWTKGPMSNSAASPIGQGLASFLLGLPTGGDIDINASRAEQSTFTGLYIQDDWKATRRLTLNFGLRYEYEGPTSERYNRSIRGYDFVTANPVEARAVANYAKSPIPDLPLGNFRVRGGLTFPGMNGQPHALWASDKNNFMPRIGLAFQIARKTVIRSGYGIFFAPTGIDRRDVNQGGFNQVTSLVASENNGLSFIGTLANPFPNGLKPQTGASLGLLTQLGGTLTYFRDKVVGPYMQRWSFSVQRELPSRVLMEMTYVGNRGTKLNATRQMNPTPREYFSTSPARDQTVINYLGAAVTNPFYGMPEFTGGLTGRTIARSQITRPMPQFQGITTGMPEGYSYYHSLQVRAEKRFTRGTSFQVGYTWSKFMEATSFLNATDPVPEKVISDQDRPHRIILGTICELPFGKGKKLLGGAHGLLNGIVGGWQAQGWYEGQSGDPLGLGNAIIYGNLHDFPLPVSQRTTDHWFNTDPALIERASGKQLGSNIRTVSSRFSGIRADGINNLDCSLFKVFRLNEKFRLQFRAEAFNSLNHAQFDAPNANPAAAAFGIVTSEQGHGQRQLNFGLKLLF